MPGSLLVVAHQLSKAFGARSLFSGLRFAIESGSRVGLIGPNGAGKSTLLQILAGQMSPDDGTLSFQKSMRIGFLEQVPRFSNPHATILECLLEGAQGFHPDAQEWESVPLAEEYLSRFGFRGGQPISKLSGGWKKRVALARELMRRPDLLLLDEPTNHLDVESILWLEELIEQAPFTTVTVTHDRAFLQRVANRIIELDRRHPGGCLSVAGDYAHYLEVRSQLISAQERREVILKNTLRRETEWLRQGAKARTTKQQARIQRAGDLKDLVADLTARNQVRTARLDFQGASGSPKKLVDATGISKSYGGRKLFSGLDLRLGPGTRVGLLGANGAGKSTLIRCLLGLEDPDEGEVSLSDSLQVAYFDQAREALDPELTVLRTLCPTGDTVEYRGTRIHIRSYLDRFLFDHTQMAMPVGKLSGGEQSRLLVARLMLQPANLLVLDEPTNDLDLATLNVLEECLTDFPGAILLVTHDRYFLDQVANQILAFPIDGSSKLIAFADLSQWSAWFDSQRAAVKAATEPKATAKPSAAAPPSSQKKRKLSFNEKRELDSMEGNIHQAEALVARLTAEVEAPENQSNSLLLTRLTAELAAAQTEVDRLYARWGELT